MKTLRGRYYITDVDFEYEIDQPDLFTKDSKNIDYYKLDRKELLEKIVLSGVYSDLEVKSIRKSGINLVIANSLAISPFAGFRYFLIKQYSKEIIKGLNIFMTALMAEWGEIIIDKQYSSLHTSLNEIVKKTPNIGIRLIKDFFPLSNDILLARKLSCFKEVGPYYPTKEGNLIIALEDILKIYIAVERPALAELEPIAVVNTLNSKKTFFWALKTAPVAEILNNIPLQSDYSVIRGSLLNGKAVSEPENEIIGSSRCFYIMPSSRVSLGSCCSCGRCLEVCPAKLSRTHSKNILNAENGLQPFSTKQCLACGLCSYFCPAWVS